jgi:hypothetical protein
LEDFKGQAKIYTNIRVIQKVCPKEEIEGKFAQNRDYHLRRSKREF